MAQSTSSIDSAITDELISDGESMVEYLQPYSVIVKNLPPTVSSSYTALGQHIGNNLGFKVEKVLSVRERREEGGYAILIFGSTAEDFKGAMQLHIHIDKEHRGKMEWEAAVGKVQPFGWLAAPEDIDEFVDKAKQFTPTYVPSAWIEGAFAAIEADTRNIYRSIQLFAASFSYIKFN